MVGSAAKAGSSAGEAGREQLLDWIEQVAGFLTPEIPPIAGRTLGWLMVCDTAEQSAGQISEAIGASRASLTTNLRLLVSAGFVSRVRRPGERTVYYRIDDNAWEHVIRRQIDSLASFLKITGDGLDLIGPEGPRAARLRVAHEMFQWMKRVFDQAPPPPSAVDAASLHGDGHADGKDVTT